MRTAVTAVYALLLAAPAFCAGGAEKITKDQALETALNRVTGISVKSAELESEGGKEVWSFDLSTPAGIREIWVDALTGKVVQDNLESAAEEKAEAARDEAAKPAPAEPEPAEAAAPKAAPAQAKADAPGSAPSKESVKAAKEKPEAGEREGAETGEKDED